LRTTVHIGIVRDGPVTSNAEALLQKALATEHQSARESSSGCVVYSPVLHYAERRAIEFQADIQRGIEAGEFSLFFQPIVDAATLRPVGAEALLRWHHPERGILLPGEFLFQAENGGCTQELGLRVVREACEWIRGVRRSDRNQRNAFVTANVSPRQLAAHGIAGKLIEVIRGYDLPAECFKLEITETAMISGSERILSALYELHEAGIGLWLDDFGKGYSSLGRLHTLPFECIKIDGSFVSSLGVDENSVKIVSAIASLGSNLGLEVLAEGIESALHVEALRKLGVRYFQGFHLARPMPPGRAARVVQETTPMPLPN
jgi:EAL domain-containing protein (putative c-di-GMP-specific phosphodiesterase class I)